MTITNLSQPYTTPHQVSSDDIDLIKIRSKETSPLTHEDLDDNFANLMNKVNSLVDLVGGSSAAISVDGNGNVGIGTSPTKPLEVAQANGNGGLRLNYLPDQYPNQYNADFYYDGLGALKIESWSASASTAGNIILGNNGGNVGIGTSPSYKLDVDVQGVGLRLKNSTAAAVNESNETPSIVLQALGWDTDAGSTAYSARIRAFGTYSGAANRGNTYPTISFDLETNENLPDDNLISKMQIGIDQVTVPTALAVAGAALDKVILAGSESPQALALAVDGTVAFNKRDVDGAEVGMYFSPGGSADHPFLSLYDKDGNHGTKISSADDSFFNVQGGNVGIGTDDPKAKLHLSTSGTDGLRLGVDSQPYYHMIRPQGDGLYLGADDGNTGGAGSDIRFNVKGEEKIRIDKDGNVGIGSTNPARLLHLRNDDSAIAFETPIDFDGSAFAQIKSGRDGNSGYSSTLEFATTESATAVPTFGSNGTGGSGFVTRMLIDSAGNVGIGAGSLNPASKLDVSGQAYFHDNVEGRAPLYVKQDGTGPSAYFMGGNVGIGTDDPDAKLEILDGSNAVRINQNGESAITFESSSLADFHIAHDGISNKLHISHGSTVNNAKLLTVNANNGNVGIGTSSPSANLHVLKDMGNINVDSSFTLQKTAYTRSDSHPEGSGKIMTHKLHELNYSGNFSTVGNNHANDKVIGLDVSLNTNARYQYAALFNGGNVGIGTDDPDNLLHIKGDAHSKVLIEGGSEHAVGVQITQKLSDGDQVWQLQSEAGNKGLQIRNASDNIVPLHLSADGEVGIGTDDPKGSLHVKCGENQNFVFQKAGTGGNTHLTMQSVNDAGNTNLDMGMGVGGNTLFLSGSGNVGINDASPTDNDHLAFSLKAKGVASHVNTINQYFKNSKGHILNYIRHREEQYGSSWELSQLSFANYASNDLVGINVVTTAMTTQNSVHVKVKDGGEKRQYLQAGRQIEFLSVSNAGGQVRTVSAGIYTIANWIQSTSDLYLTENFSLESAGYGIRMVPFRSHALSVGNTPQTSSPRVGIGVNTPEENLHVRSTVHDDITAIMIDREVHNDSGFAGFYGGFLTTRSDPTSGGLVFGAKVAGANANVFEYHNYFGSYRIVPASSNTTDLGGTDRAWQDVYVKDGTVENSDRNLKRDIEKISEAEEKVARKCKKLLRKYRWKDSVKEKGDDARIHFGIIAHDLENAFKSEGLDAGDYGMFIKNIWWEKERVIPAVEAVEAVDAVYDEEDNLISPAVEAVEAKDEETVVDTFYSKDEAPEGSAKKTRRGVRYSELLAFIMCADIVETPKPAPEPEPVVEKDGKEYIKIGKKEYEVLARNEDGSITSDDDTTNNG